jgi:hypothetical protein
VWRLAICSWVGASVTFSLVVDCSTWALVGEVAVVSSRAAARKVVYHSVHEVRDLVLFGNLPVGVSLD